MSASDRRVVVVLGMHRSGTSMLARLLAHAGVALGPRIMTTAGADNAQGYWEHAEIFAAQESLLDDVLDRTWYGPKGCLPLPQRWWEAPEVADCREKLVHILERELADHAGLWGFKDPRTARLLPLWRQVFDRIGVAPLYILAVRQPAAVAASLEKRNGMSPARGQLLWLQHNLAAVEESGDDLAAVIDYDSWFERGDEVADRLLARVGIERPKDLALDPLIDPKERHHEPSGGGFLLPLAAQTHQLLRGLADAEPGSEPWRSGLAELRSCAAALHRGEQLLAAWVESVEELSRGLRSGATVGLAPAAADPAVLGREIGALRQERDEARAELAMERESRAAWERAVQGTAATRVAELETAMAREKRAVRLLAGGDPREIVQEIWRSRSWRLFAPVRRLVAGARATQSTPPATDLEAAHVLVRLKTSTSWRLTAPLRGFVRFVRKWFPSLYALSLTGARRDAVALFEPVAPRYGAWTQRILATGADEKRTIANRVSDWKKRPLFSVIVPVRKKDPFSAVMDSLSSLVAQHYGEWEAVVPVPSNGSGGEFGRLAAVAEREPRIRLMPFSDRPSGEGAGVALAATEANGDVVLFLHPGDMLHETALFCLGEEIEAAPGAMLFYSDGDVAGTTVETPCVADLKPDFDLERALQNGLFNGLVAFKAPFDGAAAAEAATRESAILALCLSRLREKDARPAPTHIPFPLYQHRGDDALGNGAGAAGEAIRDVVRRHLGFTAMPGEVLPGRKPMELRLRYTVPSRARLLLVLRAERHVAGLPRVLPQHLADLIRHEAFDVTVALPGFPPPGDGEDEAAWSAVLDRCVFVDLPARTTPGGRLNAAIRSALSGRARGADAVAVLDVDLQAASADAHFELVSQALRPAVGVVGGKICDRRGRIVDAGLALDGDELVVSPFRNMEDDGAQGDLRMAREVIAVSIACMAFRPEVFEALRGFAEDLWYSELVAADFCLRARSRGWSVLWTPYASFTQSALDRRTFEERWGKRLAGPGAGDPFRNPNADSVTVPSARRVPSVLPPFRRR